MNNHLKSVYKSLGTTREFLRSNIAVLEKDGGVISDDYIGRIADKIVDEVAEELHETADLDNWCSDDIKLAVGRILCNHLGIEY